MNICSIRSFREADAPAVSALVIKTLRTTNRKDYSQDYIEDIVSKHTPGDILQRARWTHFYVACDGEKVIGCGAIGPYWGKADESSLFTIFVLPEYQGLGVGKAIIETLERDPFFLRARRVEIPASITALSFYKKLGYSPKNGIEQVDGELLYRLEKFR